MTREEFDNLRVGQKIVITRYMDEGRTFTLLPESQKTHCKYVNQDKAGFMLGSIFYRYQDAEIVPEKQF